MKLLIATIISKLFEPALLLAFAFIFSSIQLDLSVQMSIIWLGLLMGPIVMYRLWAGYTKALDWDIHDRAKRTKPMLILLTYLVCAGIFLLKFEPRILPLQMLFMIWTFGFSLITIFWTKISGHTGGDTLAIGMIIRYFGWTWWPLLLIIPLVSWARVVRKDHTVLQVILGVLYTVVIFVLV